MTRSLIDPVVTPMAVTITVGRAPHVTVVPAPYEVAAAQKVNLAAVQLRTVVPEITRGCRRLDAPDVTTEGHDSRPSTAGHL